jgi:hypothetical protein
MIKKVLVELCEPNQTSPNELKKTQKEKQNGYSQVTTVLLFLFYLSISSLHVDLIIFMFSDKHQLQQP